MSKLYIVATPIGNLEDITFRAVDTLKGVDVILAEDKRVTKKLLDNYKIRTKLETWHQHSSEKEWNSIKKYFEQDQDVALVTDAGTPGVSDPGGKLIELVLHNFPETSVIPIPGASALTALISVAGIPMDRFMFLGFLPHKKGRQTLLERTKQADVPVVIFESVHRIEKLLKELSDSDKRMIVGRELSKKFETIYRGSAVDILKQITDDKQTKGEFVVIIS